MIKDDGSATGSVKYRCDAAMVVQLLPAIGSRHPDHEAVFCHERTITILENSVAEIACEYLGILRDPTDYQVEFIGNVSEEPIETHKEFVSKIGGSPSQPKNSAVFDAETGEFLGFPSDAPQNLGGVRGYLNPTSTVRVSWFTKSTATGLYTLGDIAMPPGGVPNPPESRNWLKTNWSRRAFGPVYQITEEYTASGKRGWNSLIYG